MPVMPPPPPPDFQDDRSQITAPLERPREWSAWVAIGITMIAGAFGIYGSHVNAVGQIERLEERVAAAEESHAQTAELLARISADIVGLRSDVQGLERITAVQLSDIQRRIENLEKARAPRGR